MEKVIALAGNPNVGKSTVFNALTGLRQHTGNWPGKTVTRAEGFYQHQQNAYRLVDLPGCYSLMAHSAEEEVARDFICSGQADAVVVVCDASCLERNLNLVLQTIEITPKVVVCVNLMDEAKKRQIRIDLPRLSAILGVPVVGTAARSRQGLDALKQAVDAVVHGPSVATPIQIVYPNYIDTALASLAAQIENKIQAHIHTRWLSLMFLLYDSALSHTLILQPLCAACGEALDHAARVKLSEAAGVIKRRLAAQGITANQMVADTVSALVRTAETIGAETVSFDNAGYKNKDLTVDRILTGKRTAFPIMILALVGIFWLTITGANYPSQWLNDFLFRVEDWLLAGCIRADLPPVVYEPLVLGVYRVLAWVVSVMLPPMAIFFPLFTMLEDVGCLPRVAFNLDKCFKRCHACGKQALSMCMGFGCNAAGVVGCRIIDSPRERLIAIITNNFVPCNGRFPPPQLA